MDYQKRKTELAERFNKTQQIANNLLAENQQILGQLRFIEELEKEQPVEPENKPKEEKLPKVDYDK